MNLNSIYISIPTPCHESWASMDATERGAFCHSCQKEVIDFSAMTDREVIEYLSKHKNGCGQFREDQLENKLTLPGIRNGFLKWRVLILSALAVVNTNRAFAMPPKQKQAQVLSFEKNVVITTVPHGDTITIRGTVKNNKRELLKGVGVYIFGKENHFDFANTITDSTGNFELTFDRSNPTLATMGPFHIRFCKIQYHSVRVPLSKHPEQLVHIQLHKHHHKLRKGKFDTCWL